jgi:molecular chaperone GrpE (heat shock protein)
MVRILDHIFALHVAAIRSNQPKVAEQIGQFQNACRGTVRRVGLTAFLGDPEAPFDAERFQIADGKKPFDGAVVAETIAAGYTFQGKMVRPALVKLREPKAPEPPSVLPEKKPIVVKPAQDSLALEPD